MKRSSQLATPSTKRRSTTAAASTPTQITAFFARSSVSSSSCTIASSTTPSSVKLVRTSPLPAMSSSCKSTSASSSSLSSSSSSSSSLLSATTTTTTALVQTVLDLGQKNAGFTVCKECGMRYANVAKEDDLLHSKYHSSVLGGIDYKGYTQEVVVQETMTEMGTPAKIILVTLSSASVQQKRKLLEILDVVNQELGAVVIPDESLAKCKIFLYVVKAKVVGCVVAEPITSAFRLDERSDIENNGGGGEQLQHITGDTENEIPAICGISRVWVSMKHRRRGIGLKLLEACRRRFLFGCLLDKDTIAFSQPTMLGKKLATQFFQRSDFLVYTIATE
ncbi:ESCO1/2 acetyl-transferase-domain-containing protein [Obelidium mucronatum]|nr:ESCO1/2 acetyl-transferase-domain-containing protein [Obelidium mucronatum]